MKHFLVENRAVFRALALAEQHPDAVWHTFSPWLLIDLQRRGIKTAAVEERLGQEELNRLGEVALVLGRALTPVLNAAGASAGLPLGEIFHPQFNMFLTTALARARVMDVWREDLSGGELHVGGHDALSPVGPGFCRLRGWDTLCLLLARGQAVRLHPAPMEPSPAPVRDGAPGLTDRLRFLTGGKLPFALWRYGFSSRPFSAPLPEKWGDVLLFCDSEVIKESFAALALSGARIHQLRLPSPSLEPVSADSGLEHELDRTLAAALHREGLSGASLRAACGLAAQRLAQWSAAFARFAPNIERAFEDASGLLGAKRCLLTNSLADPIQLFVFQLARRRGVPVVAVQHGTPAGISPVHRKLIELHDINACDAYIDFTPHSTAFYRSAKPAAPPILTAGAPAILRKGGQPASKRRMRKRLGLNPRGTVTMVVADRFQGNGLRLPHGHLDTHYFTYQRELINVLRGSRQQFCFKLYPEGEHGDPNPLSSMQWGPNIKVFDRGIDLRYLVSAADRFIVDVPTNTFTWILSTGKPAIYVNLPFNPLISHFEEAFARAFFLVNYAKGWEEQLRELLARPKEQLEREWREKAAYRRTLMQEVFLGPSESGWRRARRIADFVLQAAKTAAATGAANGGPASPDRVLDPAATVR